MAVPSATGSFTLGFSFGFDVQSGVFTSGQLDHPLMNQYSKIMLLIK